MQEPAELEQERASVRAEFHNNNGEHFLNDDDELLASPKYKKLDFGASAPLDLGSPAVLKAIEQIQVENVSPLSDGGQKFPQRISSSPSMISIPRPRLKTLLDGAAAVNQQQQQQMQQQGQETFADPSASFQSRRQKSFVAVPKPSLTNLLEGAPKTTRSPSFVKKPSDNNMLQREQSYSASQQQQQMQQQQISPAGGPKQPPSSSSTTVSQNFDMLEILDTTLEKWCGLTPKPVPLPKTESLEILSHNDVFNSEPDQKRLASLNNMPLRLKQRSSLLYSPEVEAKRRQQEPTGSHYSRGDLEGTNVGGGGVPVMKSIGSKQQLLTTAASVDDLRAALLDGGDKEGNYMGLESLGSVSPEQFYQRQLRRQEREAREKKLADDKAAAASAAAAAAAEAGKRPSSPSRASFLLPSSLFSREHNAKNSQKRKLEESKSNLLGDDGDDDAAGKSASDVNILRRASSMLATTLSLPTLLNNKNSPQQQQQQQGSSTKQLFNRLTTMAGSFYTQSTSPLNNGKATAKDNDNNNDDGDEDAEQEDEEEEDELEADKDEAELRDEFPSVRRTSTTTPPRSRGHSPLLHHHQPHHHHNNSSHGKISSTKTRAGSPKSRSSSHYDDLDAGADLPLTKSNKGFYNPYAQLGVEYDGDTGGSSHHHHGGHYDSHDHHHHHHDSSGRHARALKEASAGHSSDAPVLYEAPRGVYSSKPRQGSPASSRYSSSVVSGVSSNLTQALEYPGQPEFGAVRVGGKQVVYTPTANANRTPDGDRYAARHHFSNNKDASWRSGKGSGISAKEKDLMGVSAYDWDMHAFKIANASAAEMVAITSEINGLLQCNSSNSIEQREKVAISALERKLAQRYAASKEDEYQEMLRQKEEEAKNERLNQDVMKGYVSELSNW